MVGVQRRNAGEGGGRPGRLGEIIVTFEAYGNADFRFGGSGYRRIWIGRCGGTNHSQNTSPAAHGHTLPQGDLRGHAKGKFNLATFGEGGAGEKKDSARAQILSEAEPFNRCIGLAQGKRKKIREPLSDTAFNSNRRSGHRGLTSFAESPKAQALL